MVDEQPPTETPPVTATLSKRRAPPPTEDFVREILHTRQCNKRDLCSCMLRIQSKKFQQELAKKKTSNRDKRIRVKGTVKITNVQNFEADNKASILNFLGPLDLATLSMVNRRWRSDVEAYAEHGTKNFVADESRKDKVLKVAKKQDQTWSQYMHLQLNCVHKLFVYYTAYKTGQMRKDTPQWAFGEVNVDPNDPMRVIMPNAWNFKGHSPWLKRKANGKGGEWMLMDRYKHGKAPKDFVKEVHDWVGTIRPGNHLAVSFQQEGSTDINWWEAQVWYVWRADGREDPAIVLDPATANEITVHPRNLLQHFQANPEHVIDVCATPGTVCNMCKKRNLNFYTCHVVKGHAMV